MTWVCIAVTVALISVSRPWGDWLQAPNGPCLSEQLQHVHMRASGVVWVSAFMFRVPLGLTSDLCVPTVTIDWRIVPTLKSRWFPAQLDLSSLYPVAASLHIVIMLLSEILVYDKSASWFDK